MSQFPTPPDREQTPHPLPAEFAPERPPPRTHKALQAAVVVGMVGLVLLPVLWNAAPGEIARWHDAAAREKYLSGDVAGAIEELGVALSWSESSYQRYRERSLYRRELGDYQGSLEDWNSVIRLAPQNANLLAERATLHHHLGKHDKALQDVAAYVEKVRAARQRNAGVEITALNLMAYTRAVANQDLAAALAQAENAVALLGGDPFILEQVGYLHTLREDWPRAKARLAAAEKLLMRQAADLQARSEQAPEKEVQKSLAEQLADRERKLAGVRFHLAQALRQLNEPKAAEAYEKLARQSGISERALRAARPSKDAAWQQAAAYSAIIDTRGYVHYRIGNYESARQDLELASELAELGFREQFLESPETRASITDRRAHERLLDELRRNVAVILYHRALVYQALGLEKLAAEDLRKVREEYRAVPDEHLF